MQETERYNVYLQRPRQPRSPIGHCLSKLDAYQRAKELVVNMIDNGGYTFTSWMAGKTIARLELNGQAVFVAIIETKD